MPQSSIPQSQLASRTPSFHHVGFVVPSIADAAQRFATSIGARWTGKIIHDPLQEVRVSFFYLGNDSDPAIELVEPDSEKSALHRFLARGGGLHHICYETDRVSAQLQQSRAAGCLIVRQPMPAVAFGGRLIAWVYSPQRLLIEYLERDREPG